MTGSRPLVVKEVRALLPLWAAALAVMVAAALAGAGRLEEYAVLAYIAGCLALGAHAIGHEYSHRALAILLAQPIARRRLLLTKASVLAPLLAALGAAAWFLVARDLEPRPPLALVLLPPAGGFFVAPLLAMLARNPLGGALLTALIAGWTFVATQVLTMKLSGLGGGEAERLALQIWQRTMYGVAAIAAVLAWRTFMRLEAIEGAGRQIHVPGWLGTTGRSRRTSPARALIAKELRLQQLTFVIAGFYMAGEILRSLLERGGYIRITEGFQEVMVPIYFGAVALVAGSLASAEERHHGTVEAQLLLPVSARKQWAFKAGITVMLAIVLGLGIPLLIASIVRPGLVTRMRPGDGLPVLVVVVALTACALYVSSLSSNAVRALTLAGPFALGLQILVVWTLTPNYATDGVVGAVGLVMAGLLMVFAGANHRRVDRSYPRAALQIAVAAALIVVGLPVLTAVTLRLIS